MDQEFLDRVNAAGIAEATALTYALALAATPTSNIEVLRRLATELPKATIEFANNANVERLVRERLERIFGDAVKLAEKAAG